MRTARYEDYAGRPGVKVRDQAAFEEMRAHVLKMYDGVRPVHTFVSDGALFDCIAIASQPAVRLLGLTRIERQPPASAVAGGYAAGRTPGDVKAIESPLRLGLKDPYGNRMSCVTETIPMARITLETMTRFTTLDDFFSKGPGGGGSPPPVRQGEIVPGGSDHLYAAGRQEPLTNFGGNSWLNLWTPTGGFTLSQQWYAGGTDGTVDHQTVEGGWVVYKEKFNSDKPVLFIFYTADNYETTRLDGRTVPLEVEETATIAAQLADSPMWKRELWGFLGRAETGDRLPILVSLTPYRRGRIPVVFVHGTASSPGRWADMVNDLLADPWIRRRCQFWFFMYDTGNPIAYSGMLLREKLTDVVSRLDPNGQDTCLRQMVVLGHSQGGLLTKLTAVDTGSRLWNAIGRVPLAEVPASEEFRNLLARALFVKPLPFVRRLVFVATPHRGSFRTGALVNGLVRRMVRLPESLVSMSHHTLTQGSGAFYAARTIASLPTAAENMTPGNPFLEGLAAIPVADGVPYHSIIAVKGAGPAEEGNDGVVAYRSAHVDGAASELVVRSSHSTQSEPATVQEVRRILHLHGAELEVAGLNCLPAAR